MKLYYTPNTRALRPRWLLEEAEAPYELQVIDLGKGEGKSPEHLARHPHGGVPALTDGDLTIIESSAICLYLADKFPDKKLAPPVGTPDRGRYYQWMVYAVATMEAPILACAVAKGKDDAAALEEGQSKFAIVARFVARELGTRSFLLGDHLTAADVMAGSLTAWANRLGLLEGHPTLKDYTRRLTERPAFQRARK